MLRLVQVSYDELVLGDCFNNSLHTSLASDHISHQKSKMTLKVACLSQVIIPSAVWGVLATPPP